MKKLTLIFLIIFNCLNSYSQEFGFTEQDIVINSDRNKNLKGRQYYVYNGKQEISKVQMKLSYAHYVEDMSIEKMNEALLQLNAYLLQYYNESNSLQIEKIRIKQGRNMISEDHLHTYMSVSIDFYSLIEGVKKMAYHTYYIDAEGKIKKYYEWDSSSYDDIF